MKTEEIQEIENLERGSQAVVALGTAFIVGVFSSILLLLIISPGAMPGLNTRIGIAIASLGIGVIAGIVAWVQPWLKR